MSLSAVQIFDELSALLYAMQYRPEVLEVKCSFAARNQTIPVDIESIKEYSVYQGIHIIRW